MATLEIKPGIITFKQASESDFAGSITGNDDIVSSRRFASDKIGQEYEYYRVLDEGDSDDEDPCSCDEETACPIHENLVLIQSEHCLLATSDSDTCPNIGRSDENSWFRDPNLYLASRGMGFLSQIAQLCYSSGISSCQNSECQTYYEIMNRTAPQCDWESFRTWAITAMSCQVMMSGQQDYGTHGRGHTHLARSVAGCCMILKECLNNGLISQTRSYLDADSPDNIIDQQSVVDLIYWMAKIQYEKTVGPDRFGSWGTQSIPPAISLPFLRAALEKVDKLGICKTRFWNFVSVGDRKEGDIPDLVRALERADDGSDSGRSLFAHPEEKHKDCNPNKCQQSSISSTFKPQLHKCDSGDCEPVSVDLDLLAEAVNHGESTAWQLDREATIRPGQPYMAISHVWADGTGQGIRPHGTVNECLFNFWADLATQEGCEGIWWDILSLPSKANKDEYKKAMGNMHNNYANAEVTLVHDDYLLNIPWSDDGLPCIALVLSTWFTRGWTALELARSKKVKVLFKDNEIRDLDEILAKSPAHASRAHWLATTWIQRLREPVNDVGDILAILSTRVTETVGDRAIIAGLLADVPDLATHRGEASITKQILGYLGRVPQSCLLHGEATMRDFGAFSWCAASLDDMPIPIPGSMESREVSEGVSMLDIDYTGAIEGLWFCRKINSKQDRNAIQAYGNNLSSSVKISAALGDWEKCLLLRPLSAKDDKALLVQPAKIHEADRTLDCRYVGAVVEDHDEDEEDADEWHVLNIRLGRNDELQDGPLEDAMGQVHEDNRKICKWCLPADREPDRGQANGGADDEDVAVSPENIPWLQWGIEYSPPELAEILPADSYEVPTLDELQRAVTRGKHRAVHHIVRMLARDDAVLTPDTMQSVIDDAHEKLGEERAREAKQVLWSLGDALVDHGKLEEAVLVYEQVLNYATASFVDAAVTYNLGMLKAMLGDYDGANERFEEALKIYNEHSETGNSNVKGVAPGRGAKNKGQKGGKGGKKAVRLNPTLGEDLEDWEVAEEGWMSVWWNATAALVLLCASQHDEDGWIDRLDSAYNAILRFGENNATSRDVFGKEPGGDLQRDEASDEVMDSLRKALKKFNVIFHRDHPLIFITARILGNWLMCYAAAYEEEDDHYMARAYWNMAQEQFERAQKGLVVFGFLPSWQSEDESQNWWLADTESKLQILQENLQT